MIKLGLLNKNKMKEQLHVYLNIEDSISIRKVYELAKTKSSIWISSNKSELSNKSFFSFPVKTYLEEQKVLLENLREEIISFVIQNT